MNKLQGTYCFDYLRPEKIKLLKGFLRKNPGKDGLMTVRSQNLPCPSFVEECGLVDVLQGDLGIKKELNKFRK